MSSQSTLSKTDTFGPALHVHVSEVDHSMHRSRALNLIVDRFHTNKTLIYSYGLLYYVA